MSLGFQLHSDAKEKSNFHPRKDKWWPLISCCHLSGRKWVLFLVVLWYLRKGFCEVCLIAKFQHINRDDLLSADQGRVVCIFIKMVNPGLPWPSPCSKLSDSLKNLSIRFLSSRMFGYLSIHIFRRKIFEDSFTKELKNILT